MTRLLKLSGSALLICASLSAFAAHAAQKNAPAHAKPAESPVTVSGEKALAYAAQLVAIGPRWPTSPGHAKAEAFIKNHFAHDNLEADSFIADTPVGKIPMTNFIVKFQGTQDGVIVLATHYETNYWLRKTKFVGANDGASTTGLLMAIGDKLRENPPQGYSIWLVFFDGEESINDKWTHEDSLYGSRHLASKWQVDGTLKKIKAFFLLDMIGDKDLDIDRDSNSTGWLQDITLAGAAHFGFQSYFFARQNTIEDDHLPFVQRGVPSVDIIDIDYGYNNAFHHTEQDTMDKISAKSLTIVGDTVLETIDLLNHR
jgi:glutaminyl-peptide cyclotransferase